MRVFLSYGHDQYAVLASRLKQDLKAQGHRVWFDVARLKPGGDWEQYIEDGLDWASAVPGEGRFLLLLTPHSVRRGRPNGYCLNELARAFGRNLPIIPVMLSTVEPPLSICRLQSLDMRNCFPAEAHEVQYAKQFELLVNALVEKHVPFEGVQQRLLNYLNPVSYDDDLTKHLFRFTGREWVMREVDEWLASSRRVLWITGDAGVGKSALAAWLCHKRPEIAAYHFCRFGNSDRVDARRTLLSLAYQLSTQIPVYQDRLNASPLDKTVIETNVHAIFDRLFVNLLTETVPIADKPQVLLIDALDEATINERNELASLISDEIHRLPSWLRVILTSRPHEQEINLALQALDPWTLEAGRAENRQDIRAYLRRELRPFTGNGEPSNDIVNAIVERSEGLFLYVSWVRQELQDGRLSLARVGEFPRGLGGVYADFFRRYFPDVSEYESGCRPALEAVCAAREPLERRDLAALLGWPEYDMRSLTARLGSLFPVVDGRVRPFHHSVRDWLTDPQRSGPYWIDVSAQEQRLADFAWREYKTGVSSMTRYCIKFAPSHLAACQRKTELKELLLDPDWIQAKLRATGVVPLLADYDLVLDILSPESTVGMDLGDDPETGGVRTIQWALRLSSHVIEREPAQFASQMTGRLLAHVQPINAVQQVAGSAARAAPRLVHAALCLPLFLIAQSPLRLASLIMTHLRAYVPPVPGVREFTSSVASAAPRPWLRPLQPALHPPGMGLVRTLASDTVSGNVAVTEDGSRVVSASDKRVTVWDLITGRELFSMAVDLGFFPRVVVSGDGRRAASNSLPDIIRLWDLEAGHELRTLRGRSASMNGDGRLVVSASKKTVKVWDCETGRELHVLSGHLEDIESVAVSGDGRRAVSASSDNTVKVWDLEASREIRSFTSDYLYDCHVAISGNGRRAVCATSTNLTVWDLETGRELRIEHNHRQGGKDLHAPRLAVTWGGLIAVSAAPHDQEVKVWDLETGREVHTLTGNVGGVLDVAVSRDGRLLVTACKDNTLKVWHLESGRELLPMPGHRREVVSVAASGNGRRAISSDDGTLRVWNLKTGRQVRSIIEDSSSVAVSFDGRRAVSEWSHMSFLGRLRFGVRVWNVRMGLKKLTLAGHSHSVVAVALSRDGRRAVSASKDLTLKVWDLKMGRELWTLPAHSEPVDLAMSGDGRRAVSTSAYETLTVWDLDTGREMLTIADKLKGFHAVEVTGDGQRAVSACSGTHELTVWDLERGCELLCWAGHSGSITDLAVSGDGQWVVSSSYDKTVKLWRLSTGELVTTFTCDAPALCCAFGGRDRVVAGDALGRVHVLALELDERLLK